MILLRDLLAPWFHYPGPESVNMLTLDSRAVVQGGLFVAIPGHKVDGRQFVDQALARGALALVHTDDPDAHGRVNRTAGASGRGIEIAFFQLSRQLSALAAQFYPLHRSCKLVGITGTNGKTSVSQLLAQLVSLAGDRAAVMGTLGNGLWGELVDSGNTTADAITLMQQLAQFEARGAKVCAMEVSSHGLVQGRVAAVPFDTAVFTNLSRDHLDYHGDMDAYALAKRRLFGFTSLQHGLINLDDAVGLDWFRALNDSKILGFSTAGQPQASFFTKDASFHEHGVEATLVWPEGEARLASPLLGAFNLSNLVAAVAALYLQGYDMHQLLSLVPELTPVPGRMERFTTAAGVTLVVDYAHTPDAIAQALQALRGHCPGELWCLFGCGGERDKGKRPLMAKAAEAFADRLMITSDNARSEAPQAIIADIFSGLSRPDAALSDIDRVSAIKRVLALAKGGDLLLLAGKGHETYQEIGGVRLDYDERALARQLAEGSL
ncbi:UDP-N-acetylmuramoyl-L-alanyl-D-glutamate--2,6-diaminopimelate ligase [Shewanella sp. AS16]|uniref:UDP-N-acetylmuramoyl-L-alanyl-D-glutamate--2, 6-diaminopimelate ligase n=1 Tax=Shewanella sp. AS16 TaxID=2907625 RepID=UPI001F1C6E1F|nr:UDP-N-acetylmuramoyl-L-alanyl-D-glutamate--2,6-diaminopimelate ligase [Shewanella sp. AS16]MCE9688033.1 UDP-N-acetylmuramoyl-L-alanyl-D-glutamate--2,6-diaminopimelate ligase [Shewanella sp. AS16]